ncbi:MAG: adenine-specific DNA-methyltransferase, partial [Acidobacteriota bacterium]|nr:adenine-specific DNA-methyltransferase [Acidobacteriota bacterium]
NVNLERQAFPKINTKSLEGFPIVPYKENHRIISLSAQILAAKGANPDADTTALEKEIDRLVYELYGLTDEEIKIVEGE